jgi:hypothetical protein
MSERICSQEEFYEFFWPLPDKELSRRLDLCQAQMKLVKESDVIAATNLFNMEMALIAARAGQL